MATYDPLADAFNRIRKINPRAFDDNVLPAMAKYVADLLQGIVDAPADTVLEMQGRAKQARAFYRVLRECHHQDDVTGRP